MTPDTPPLPSMESIRSAIKNNNEWFYDKPSKQESMEEIGKYAAAYFKLAPKWIQLNAAVNDAVQIIDVQNAMIVRLTAQVDRFIALCDDNGILSDDIARAKNGAAK
jgi:hypothetical protein